MAEKTTGLRQSTLSFEKSQGGQRKRKSKDEETNENNQPDRKKAHVKVPKENGVIVKDEIGDLFGVPANSVLIHACNCQGEWGAGIAKAFRLKYKQAFETHKKHCEPFKKDRKTRDLLGTAQLIEPQTDDDKRHFIGCLFTSDRFGRAKDSIQQILEATEDSMKELIDQINEWNKMHEDDASIKQIYMCKINSGAFKVPWEKTKSIIEDLEEDLIGVPREITVLTPEGM